MSIMSHDSALFIPVKVSHQNMLEKKMTHPFNESVYSSNPSTTASLRPQEPNAHPILYTHICNYQAQKKFLKIVLDFLPPKSRQNGMILLQTLASDKIVDFDAKDNVYKGNKKIPKAKTSKLILSLLNNPTSLVRGEEIVLQHLKNHDFNQLRILNPHKWNIARKNYFQQKHTPLKKRLFKK